MLKTYYLEMKNAPNVQGKKQADTIREQGNIVLTLKYNHNNTNLLILLKCWIRVRMRGVACMY